MFHLNYFLLSLSLKFEDFMSYIYIYLFLKIHSSIIFSLIFLIISKKFTNSLINLEATKVLRYVKYALIVAFHY